MKNTYWEISIKNPVNDDIIEKNNFDSIKECSEKYNKIPLSTWRNIAMGRSKIYNNFIKMVKKNKNEKDEQIVLSFD